MEFDRATIDAGWARLAESMSTERADSWVPPGAVRFDPGIAGRPLGSTEPVTAVVSAQAPEVQIGRIEPAKLPPCGGEPVGIE